MPIIFKRKWDDERMIQILKTLCGNEFLELKNTRSYHKAGIWDNK